MNNVTSRDKVYETMLDDAGQRHSDATECSPKSLAKKIEGCIVRNAYDEERRAQKALFLLKTRDRRIAFLEKRVAELEDTATSLHEISLRNSSGTSTLERSKDVSDTDTSADVADKKIFDDVSSEQLSVPRLKLSVCSVSNLETEVFSTPLIDFIHEKKKRQSPTGEINDAVDEILSKKSEHEIEGNTVSRWKSKDGSVRADEKAEGNVRGVLCGKQQRSRLTRCSSSVPWIRGKHSLRKKLRGFEVKTGKQLEELPAGDGHLTFAAFRTIETGSTPDQRGGRQEVQDGAKRTERSAVVQEQNVASVNAQEARLTAVRKIDPETKATFTQTSATDPQPSEKILRINEEPASVNVYLGRTKSSTFWNIEEDPAPQWLIEEALNRDIEHNERWTKGEPSPSKETEYETIILDLEAQLSRAKKDLDEALTIKSLAKEKYKRSMESVKTEARKEIEMLQDKIVRICTSVLENFGPRALAEKNGSNCQVKRGKHLKHHEKISSKLYKKLRMAVAKSKKLKRELTTVRRELENKSKKYESISKCFDRLKQETDTTETNLNKLISENLELKKSMEYTREWMEHNVGKEHHEKTNVLHFRDAQRSRELTNLKKKSEEDVATIAQLRNKLLRSESANANKGFLLNSYKSQLSDLNKEKGQLLSKISSLENEITAAKNNNSQLKAKISVLNSEKSKTDITEKMEMQCANCKKCEETVQQEANLIKASYESTIKSVKTKMIAAEDQNIEFSKAIKSFLKRVYDYRDGHETQRSSKEDEASEKEAQETACSILNMSPEELSGFINGKTSNSVSSWMLELNRIIGKHNFSENLSKFLFKKTMKKIKT